MKSLKKLLPLWIAAGMAFLLPNTLQAQNLIFSCDFSGQQNIVDKASLVSQEDSLLGFNLAVLGGVWRDIKASFEFSYCRRKAEQIGYGISNISEFSMRVGGRYYTPYPTFSLGQTGVRLTFSALGGFSLLSPAGFSSDFQFTARLSGGLSIDVGESAAVLIEFVYRPVSMEMELRDDLGTLFGTLLVKPSWCISVGFVF
jgi:hypothetical protein